jgi:hypothetical protein
MATTARTAMSGCWRSSWPRGGAHVDLASVSAFLDRLGTARQKYPERVETLDKLPRPRRMMMSCRGLFE